MGLEEDALRSLEDTALERQTARRSLARIDDVPLTMMTRVVDYAVTGHAAVQPWLAWLRSTPKCSAVARPVRGRSRARTRARLPDGPVSSWNHAIRLWQRDPDAVRRDGPRLQRSVKFRHCAGLRH